MKLNNTKRDNLIVKGTLGFSVCPSVRLSVCLSDYLCICIRHRVGKSVLMFVCFLIQKTTSCRYSVSFIDICSHSGYLDDVGVLTMRMVSISAVYTEDCGSYLQLKGQLCRLVQPCRRSLRSSLARARWMARSC